MSGRLGGLNAYVPAAAAAWDQHAAGSSWRVVDGSLVFVDISGFTALSERLAERGRIGAEELTTVLDYVFGRMLGAANSRGGTLLKFGGDALLLLFEGDDHTMQACAATVEMRATLRDASKEMTSVGRINLKMSSGIHTGAIDLFLVGDRHRELIVTGPAATTTTLMESTAEANEIVVSTAVRDRIPADFIGASRGEGWLLRKRRINHPTSARRTDATAPEGDVSRFVPLGLRRHLLANITDSEHRIATIGFLEFKGTDRLLEEAGPERVAEALDQLVTTVQDAVDAEDVTFLSSDIYADGGKLIFASGIPTSQHDDEGSILRAARRILDRDLYLSVRVGINRGHVFAGDLGTDFRRTYTVMGDTVNLAARLMAAAPDGRLYSTPSALDQAATLFRTEALEPFHVKGKEQVVQAYEVFEEIGARPPELVHELPFHGREPELNAIVQIVTTCARVGRGGIMTVSGETGIGKTRLIAEVLERCPGLATLMVKAEPNGSDNPYWAFRDPMRRKLGIERSDQATMADALAETVRRLSPELTALLPLVGDVLHIVIPENETTGAIDPRFRPDRTADAVIELLTIVHDDEPLALVAEDGQWIDAASAALLRRLGLAAERRPWTVIVTARTGEEGHETFGDEIRLKPLDDVTIREIAIEVTAPAPLRPHELDRIVARSGGNPLFLSETLNVVRDTGNADSIPDSLDAVVSTQIDTLAPLVRQTLRYSSVLGTSFPRAVLEKFLAPDEIELDESTERELTRFLESDESARLRFRHNVVHDVAYQGLSYRRRRQLHERAGNVVELMSGDDPDSSAEFLAYQFFEAGTHEKAWRYSHIAAERARSAYANVEAAAHYQRAIEAARHLGTTGSDQIADMWIHLSDVRHLVGQVEASRDALTQALRANGGDPTRRSDIFFRRAQTWMRSGKMSEAKRSITLGRRGLEPDQSPAHLAKVARLDALEASVLASVGNIAQAARLAELASRRAAAASEDEALARAYHVLEETNFMTGKEEGRYGPMAIEIYQRLGLVERSAAVMNNMGANAYLNGRWDEAVGWYEKAMKTAERSGNVPDAALIMANIAEVWIGQHRYDEARELLREARRVFQASRSETFLPLVGLLEARASMALGDVGVAVTQLESLADDVTPWIIETVTALAEAHVRADRPRSALDLLDTFDGEQSPPPLSLQRVRALAHLALTDVPTVLAELRALRQRAAAEGEIYEELLILQTLTDAIRRTGYDPDPADLERLQELERGLGISRASS